MRLCAWTGIPRLGDVPLIRRLFGRTGDNVEKSEPVVLVTPEVLPDHAPEKTGQPAAQALSDTPPEPAPVR